MGLVKRMWVWLKRFVGLDPVVGWSCEMRQLKAMDDYIAGKLTLKEYWESDRSVVWHPIYLSDMKGRKLP